MASAHLLAVTYTTLGLGTNDPFDCFPMGHDVDNASGRKTSLVPPRNRLKKEENDA